MANNLFNSMNVQNFNPFSQIINEARALKQGFKGNPKEEVLKLLNSGQMSQADFNRYSQMAQQILGSAGGNL